MPSRETRRKQRLTVLSRIELLATGSRGDSYALRDISPTGMCVYGKRLETGTVVRFAMAHPTRSRTVQLFQIRAVVIWSVGGHAGLRFLNSDLLPLRLLCERLEREGGARPPEAYGYGETGTYA